MTRRRWRLVDALEWGSQELEEQGVENSWLEAQLLLGHVLNRRRDYLYLNSEDLLSGGGLVSFRNLIERRRERVPWQYLTGHVEFMSLDFLVGEGVMIPRPETEILVETAIRRLSTMDYRPLTVFDLGTGCGNIAVALARALPCQVYAIDVSEDALQVARVNAERLNVGESITFLQGNVFALNRSEGSPAAEEMKLILRDLQGKVDLVISNPPYVATGELGQLQPEVSCFEPPIALDGGEDGLKFYPPLIEIAAIFLGQSGYLALETGINQAEAVKQFVRERGQFRYPEVVQDYSGIERVIIAQKQ